MHHSDFADQYSPVFAADFLDTLQTIITVCHAAKHPWSGVYFPSVARVLDKTVDFFDACRRISAYTLPLATTLRKSPSIERQRFVGDERYPQEFSAALP